MQKMPLHKTPRSVFWGWQTFKKLKEDWCTKATHLQISSIIDSWVNVRIMHCVYHLSIHLHPIFSHLPPCSRPVHYLQKSLEAKPQKDSCNGLISQTKNVRNVSKCNLTEKTMTLTCAFPSIFQTPWDAQNTTRSWENREKRESESKNPRVSLLSRLWDAGIDRSMCQAGVITHEPGMRSSTSLDFVSFVKWCQILMVLHVGKRSWNFHI